MKSKRAQAVCGICGRAKNSFADLKRMTKRTPTSIDTLEVCATPSGCRKKAEQQGYK